MLFATVAAAVVAGQGTASGTSAPPQAAVISLEAPDARAIDTSPRIVAIPAVPSADAIPFVATHRVRVRVTAGDRVLFDDAFRIRANGNASYSENRHEASAIACPSLRHSNPMDRQSLNIQLYMRDHPQWPQAVNVSVNWQRPSETAACLGDGTRSVALAETIPLQPGQWMTVRGDGGLTVSVTAD